MATRKTQERKHTEEVKFRCTKEQKAFLDALPWGEGSRRLRDAVDGMKAEDEAKEKKRARDARYREKKRGAA